LFPLLFPPVPFSFAFKVFRFIIKKKSGRFPPCPSSLFVLSSGFLSLPLYRTLSLPRDQTYLAAAEFACLFLVALHRKTHRQTVVPTLSMLDARSMYAPLRLAAGRCLRHACEGPQEIQSVSPKS
jgi:hypothetical protein